MDDIDSKILSSLAKNARISYRDLGEQVHLSANAAAERIRRMEQSGVILGFSLKVSPAALGLPLQAFIDLKLEAGASMQALEKALRKLETVREATVLTGAWDARLRVACTDPAHLGRFIEELRTLPGIRETSSTVICNELRVSR